MNLLTDLSLVTNVKSKKLIKLISKSNNNMTMKNKCYVTNINREF